MTEQQTIDPAPPVDDGDEDNYGGWRRPAVQVQHITGLRPRPPRIVNPLAPVRTLSERACGFDGGGAWLECEVLTEGGAVVRMRWRGPGSALRATWPPS